MRNTLHQRPPGNEAQLEYAPGSYRVIRPGTHVTCSVTGVQIPLEELRYWSFERQEAYSDAAAASRAWARTNDT